MILSLSSLSRLYVFSSYISLLSLPITYNPSYPFSLLFLFSFLLFCISPLISPFSPSSFSLCCLSLLHFYFLSFPFDIYFFADVKPYPALQSTQSDVEQLEKIYSLFRQYKEFQESMSSMLWGDLDITALQKVFILHGIYLYQSGSSTFQLYDLMVGWQ